MNHPSKSQSSGSEANLHSSSHDRKKATQYETRYLAFVDILGFAAIVERSKTEPGLIEQLHSALSNISAKAIEAKSLELGLEVTTFSDTLVLSIPVAHSGLFHLTEILNQLSTTLLSMNMLFRGAIVRGDVLHVSNVVFGPAMVAAYKLEVSTSFHPRIIFDGPVCGDAQKAAADGWHEQYSRYIVTDSHDVPYLNPFAQWYSKSNSWSESDLMTLVQLQMIIATGLVENADNPPVGEKYRWLARKLNLFVRIKSLQNKIAVIDFE